MKPVKVFGIGLNKTGTKSLQSALRMLGFERHQSCRHDLLAAFRAGRLQEVFAVTDANESFEDWPYPLLFRELYARYTDRARYILTTRRTPATWLDSLKQHALRTPPDGHARILAYGHAYPHGLEREYLALYDRHITDVRAFFAHHGASHLLLEVCWETGDGWRELCPFLNEPIPAVPFPFENKGDTPIPPDIHAANLQRIAAQMKSLGLDAGRIEPPHQP